jgi:hypothetical protein
MKCTSFHFELWSGIGLLARCLVRLPSISSSRILVLGLSKTYFGGLNDVESWKQGMKRG